jgi:alkyldihydroxyacetonephosphate synthase
MEETLRQSLLSIVGPESFSEDPEDIVSYARDLWPRTTILARGGTYTSYSSEAILWPKDASQLSRILKLCNEHNLPFVPFGAGSGVCGGTVAIRGGLCIDTKRMNRVLWFDKERGLARVECGINGQILEETLNRNQLTLGHFPSSIYCSTLGGFLAARSAGQLSTKFGKMEDMVSSAEVVLPDGSVVEVGQERPDLLQALVGAEGTLGFFTQATLRVHPLAEERLLRGIKFTDVATGARAIREILHAGIRPAVVRLYDELDTWMALAGGKKEGEPHEKNQILEAIKQRVPQDRLMRAAFSFALQLAPKAGVVADLGPRLLGAGCLLILAFEGKKRLVQAEELAALDIAARLGGKDLGRSPGEAWLQKRYAVSYRLSKVFDAGAFADTMEIAITWNRLMPLYDAVRKALQDEAVVMAHFSHAYHEGCSIYFTFSSSAPDEASSLERYDRIWKRALDAALAVGASTSHHHGIGLLKAQHLRRELGTGGALLDALKHGFDEKQLSNPGKLGFTRTD